MLKEFAIVSEVLVWTLAAWWLLERWPGIKLRRKLPLKVADADILFVLLLAFIVRMVEGYVGGLFLAGAGEDDAGKSLGLICATTLVGHVAGFIAIVKSLYWLSKTPARHLGVHRVRAARAIVYGFLQALAWLPLIALATAATRLLVPQVQLHPVQAFVQSEHGLGTWLLIFFGVAAAAPLLEELVFRGVLQAYINRFFPPQLAIVAAAALFGAVHSSTWPDPVPLTMLGIGLGLTYQRTRSLWAPIAMHATFNGTMLLVGALQA